jgi:hypothetical protein
MRGRWFAVGILALATGNALADEPVFVGLRLPARADVNLSEAQGLRLSLGTASAAPLAAAGWTPPRLAAEDPLAPAAPGLGSATAGMTTRNALSDVPEARALLDYRVRNWTLSGSFRQGLGPRATTVDVGASYGFSLAPRHQLALLGTLGVGSHDATRTYFGETELLPRASGLGFRDVGARLSLLYSFDQSWYVNTSLGYSRLLLDPQDLGGADRNVTSVGASVGFRF